MSDGGTASKLVNEFHNGSSAHLIKAKERLIQLNNISKSNSLNLNDLDITDALRCDLEESINLFE